MAAASSDDSNNATRHKQTVMTMTTCIDRQRRRILKIQFTTLLWVLMIPVTWRTWRQIQTVTVTSSSQDLPEDASFFHVHNRLASNAVSSEHNKNQDKCNNNNYINVTLPSFSLLPSPVLSHPPRFLMGIFIKFDDRNRRNVIRRALKMFNDSRVCSLGGWDGEITAATTPPPPPYCELVYTFVVGANPNGPTQLVANSGISTPILATRPKSYNSMGEPNDVTFLNIKENKVHGKTPTWFYFASQVMATFGLDYAIKTDHDTYLRVDEFFDISKTILASGASRMYSGKAHYCKLNQHAFMQGQFYILSRDLAETVASTSLEDVNNTILSEDRDLGHVLYIKYPPPLYMVELRDVNGNFPWYHPLKAPRTYRNYMIDDSLRLQAKKNLLKS